MIMKPTAALMALTVIAHHIDGVTGIAELIRADTSAHNPQPPRDASSVLVISSFYFHKVRVYNLSIRHLS
jgi:hypothetical protein